MGALSLTGPFSKTILPSHMFVGYFTSYANQLLDATVIKAVSYQQHSFKQEALYHGPGLPKTFPVLDKTDTSYNLTVTLEETEDLQVIRFIESAKRVIMNSDSLYNPPTTIKSALNFTLDIYNMNEAKLYGVYFPGIYYLNCQEITVSYDINQATQYVVTFGYDNFEYTK